MSNKTDFDHFIRACYRWQNSEDVLAIEFKSRQFWFPGYVTEAFCFLNDYEYAAREQDRELPPGFHFEATQLVKARDTRLRDKILSLKRNREGVPSAQLSLF